MPEPAVAADHPVARVERMLRRVSARMAGLAICNPALRGEAVGFRPWQGLWLGAAIAPWAVSLLLVPGDSRLRKLRLDERERWSFPSGAYDFAGGEDPDLGVFQACSLLSPPDALASQEEARAAAAAALEALLQPAGPGPADPSARHALSRRAFLRFGR